MRSQEYYLGCMRLSRVLVTAAWMHAVDACGDQEYWSQPRFHQRKTLSSVCEGGGPTWCSAEHVTQQLVMLVSAIEFVFGFQFGMTKLRNLISYILRSIMNKTANVATAWQVVWLN